MLRMALQLVGAGITVKLSLDSSNPEIMQVHSNLVYPIMNSIVHLINEEPILPLLPCYP